MYYIYHDTNIGKIGCTKNPVKRMEEQQGLVPWKNYVVDQTEDKLEASHLEAYYKGYAHMKWDNETYYNKKSNKMGYVIKKTAQAKYFSDLGISKEGFSEVAREGVLFKDGDKEYRFGPECAPQLSKIAQTSFKATGIYFVPKAITNLHEECKDICTPCSHNNSIPEFQQIRDWAEDKGIYEKGDAKTQMVKLMEEVGETSKAILNDDQPEIEDGLGDCLVVLINLSHLCGYPLEQCLDSAYNVIKNRKGSMKGGTFVKESL